MIRLLVLTTLITLSFSSYSNPLPLTVEEYVSSIKEQVKREYERTKNTSGISRPIGVSSHNDRIVYFVYQPGLDRLTDIPRDKLTLYYKSNQIRINCDEPNVHYVFDRGWSFDYYYLDSTRQDQVSFNVNKKTCHAYDNLTTQRLNEMYVHTMKKVLPLRTEDNTVHFDLNLNEKVLLWTARINIASFSEFTDSTDKKPKNIKKFTQFLVRSYITGYTANEICS